MDARIATARCAGERREIAHIAGDKLATRWHAGTLEIERDNGLAIIEEPASDASPYQAVRAGNQSFQVAGASVPSSSIVFLP